MQKDNDPSILQLKNILQQRQLISVIKQLFHFCKKWYDLQKIMLHQIELFN
jgi:hypothetical protein